MKNIKFLVFGLAAMLTFSACSESWLDNELNSSTISQEEFEKLNGTIEGSVRGLYTFMYSVSDHDMFGQKSIDIATDLLSCDMAMSADAYGWFTTDAQRNGSSSTGSRNSYMWSYYYRIIMNANAIVRNLSAKQADGTELTQMEKKYLAETLTMRAYCYFSIVNFYTPGLGNTQQSNYGGAGLDYRTAPIYTETTYDPKTGLVLEQDLSTKAQLFEMIHSDLGAAIAYFDALDADTAARSNKLFVNADIARAFSAYTFLLEEKYDTAYKVAKEVIDAGNFSIIPYDEVTTTGFTDVNCSSWMWGLDVTVENTGSLASFWGHIDTHTYSYAYAGALKVIDKTLYESIPETDIRKKWFDATKLNPDFKFYDLARGTGNNIDRRWLNDYVYMRIEEMYLVGAEAAARDGKETESRELLKPLVEARDTNADVDALTGSALLSSIYYNWRIEMWGEGRGLMTFKRFGEAKTTGGNNYFVKNQDLNPTDYQMTFQLPYAEYSGNSQISTQTDAQ